jgi:hypothetical protein
MFDERSEVSNILAHAALSGWTLALTVAATVVGENPKRLRQSRHDKVPVVVRVPRPMDENHRNVAVAAEFVEQSNPVYVGSCHAISLRWLSP